VTSLEEEDQRRTEEEQSRAEEVKKSRQALLEGTQVAEEEEEEENKGEEEGQAPTNGEETERERLTKRSPHDLQFGKVLGEGSYGQVRAARDIATGLVLAVKVRWLVPQIVLGTHAHSHESWSFPFRFWTSDTSSRRKRWSKSKERRKFWRLYPIPTSSIYTALSKILIRFVCVPPRHKRPSFRIC